jgi:hypothetical protein
MTLKPCPIDAANLVAALTAPEASFDCDCEPSCSMCFKCFVRSQAIALAQWYLESLAAQDAEKVAERIYYMIRGIELDIPMMAAVDLKAEILSVLRPSQDGGGR